MTNQTSENGLYEPATTYISTDRAAHYSMKASDAHIQYLDQVLYTVHQNVFVDACP